MDVMAGPQVDVPVSNGTQCESVNVSGWQGMTIKDILEKVDLFNITTMVDDDEQKLKDTQASLIMPDLKDASPKSNVSTPKPTFLGPKIWKKPAHFYTMAGTINGEPEHKGSMDATRAEFSVMNIDEFLNENSFDVNRFSPPVAEDIFDAKRQREHTPTRNVDAYRTEMTDSSSVTSDDTTMDNGQPLTSSIDAEMPQLPSSGFGMKRNIIGTSPQSSAPWNMSRNELPKGGNNFLYAESKRARIEREKEERRRREEASMDFSSAELALATIPGVDFDPTRRQFSVDELRPQPIIRKRRKTYVDTDRKDDNYWEKRGKNNVAARRSREARRLKENQIFLRTAFLEKQNAALQAALQMSNEKNEKLILDKKILMEKLNRYGSIAPFLDDAVI